MGSFNRILLSSLFSVLLCHSVLAAEPGVTNSQVVFGSVLALKGKAKGLGTGMQKGLNAALSGQSVKGREIVIKYLNDFYEPRKARNATTTLLDQGVFLMIGNVGTPTAKVTLPLLAEANVPAVGFFTGAGILRPAPGPVVNFRASYIQETAAVINQGVANGIKPSEICAYVQNDSYGMAGLIGVRQALTKHNADPTVLDLYNKIINMKGVIPARNGIGPVGVYQRNTNKVRPGYQSLVDWEKASGQSCRLVVTVGAYGNISHFVRVANVVNSEKWIISAVSFTGAENYRADLTKYKATAGVLMTQIVPLLSSDLAIVKEAKQMLKDDFGFVSLEGYIVGKMTLSILNSIEGELTRDNFMKKVKKTKFSLGGLAIDFSTNPYQGSNLVIVSQLKDGRYVPATPKAWKAMMQ